MAALPTGDRRRNRILRILLDADGVTGLNESRVSGGARDLCFSSVWFVKEGLVRRYRPDCGRSVLVDLHGPGSVACSFVGADSLETLVADPGSQLIELPIDELAAIGTKQPVVLTTVLFGLAQHQQALRARLLLSSKNRSSEWLGGIFLLLAEDLGGPCRHGRPDFVDIPSFTHQEIADLTARTRPTVSACIRELFEEGRIVKNASKGFCVLREAKNQASTGIDVTRLGA